MGSVVIVGAGAMGLWLAARLLSTGETTRLHILARPATRRAIEERGLVVHPVASAEQAPTPATVHVDGERFIVVDDAAELPGRVDLLIWAVRAYQTRDAVALVADAGVVASCVLTLQNGLGNAEALDDTFGSAALLVGTTSHGVTRREPNIVLHAGSGDTVLGPWNEQEGGMAVAHRIALWLTGAGIDCGVMTDPRRALWLKVAVNAAINPLTALTRVTNGELLDGGDLEAMMRSAAREAAQVAQAEGIDVGEDEAEEAAVLVAGRTARNRSSMLQALEAGKRLESDAITGEIVRRARAHGIPVPTNERLWARLNDL